MLDAGTLFVKRVVALPGDTVSTDADGATHVRSPASGATLARAASGADTAAASGAAAGVGAGAAGAGAGAAVLDYPPLPADSALAPLVRSAPPHTLAPGEYGP